MGCTGIMPRRGGCICPSWCLFTALVRGDVLKRFATSSTIFAAVSRRPCLDISPGSPVPVSSAIPTGYEGWLWAQGHHRDLVLVGFTLGSCIALQYALDYPEEVQGLVLMTVSMRPKPRAPDTLDFRLRAAAEPTVYEQWIASMREAMHWVAPALRERLIACHRQVGPRSQHDDLVVIDQFDVRDRIHTLQPPLLLIRGADDPLAPEEYEREMHEAVPGSQYMPLREAGHFPMAEQPETVNQAIQTFLDRL